MPRPLHVVLLPLVAVLLLSACDQPGQSPEPSDSPSAATPTPTETDSGEPTDDPDALDDDVLFVITATAIAPNGAVAELIETVRGPFDITTLTTSQEAALDDECTGWRTTFATDGVVRGTFTATEVSGDWPLGQIAIDLGAIPAFAGDVEALMAYCASDSMQVPGTATGVSLFDAASGADGPRGWADSRYGFGFLLDPYVEEPGPNDPRLTDCTIVLGPAAAGSMIAATWPGAPEIYSGSGCYAGDDWM